MGYQQTPIIDVTHLKNRADLIPKIGLSYTNIDELKPIVKLLNSWHFETALNKLDSIIWEDKVSVDAMLLKGEVFALFEENQRAMSIYEDVLRIDSDNIYANVGRLIQLNRIKADQKEIDDNLSRLNNLSIKVHGKFIQTLDFMNKYKNSFDMTCLEEEIDTICVCGYFLNEDGSLPDKLTKRLDKVIEVARRSKSAQVLLSGGAVQNKYSEAEAMKNYLVKAGIAASNIHTFNQARDTVGNLIEFIDYFEKFPAHKVCVVTSKDHLPRAWMSLVIGVKEADLAIKVYGESPESNVNQQMIDKEHALNYQTLFRVAGLFEKKDIDKLLNISK